MGGKAGRKRRSSERRRARRISVLLKAHYPDARIALHFSSPFELLVATVLSAQCTDVRVNQVTPKLFAKYRSVADYAMADSRVLMREIRSTGFYRNKAAGIINSARQIVERHGARVPNTMEELVSLPGIGRKSANVILGNAFAIPGMVVDTHVLRVSRRLGLTAEKDPGKVERDLMELFPRERWTKLSHQIIAHGRRTCKAPRPLCWECFFDSTLCPARESYLRA